VVLVFRRRPLHRTRRRAVPEETTCGWGR